MQANEPAVFRHKILLVKPNKSLDERDSVYEAVRYGWRLRKARVEQTEVVLAIDKQDVIIDAFIPCKWVPVTRANFPGRREPDAPKSLGFVGKEAPDNIKSLYVGKRLPDEYCWKPGQQGRFRYTW